MSKVKMLIMDVDGTLTDGKIYLGNDGEIMKAFSVKDGYAVVKMHLNDIIPVIITRRQSEIVKRRAEELKIIELYQGVEDKVVAVKNVCQKHNILLSDVAYIGDDMNDNDAMVLCGIKGCPTDAADGIKKKNITCTVDIF